MIKFLTKKQLLHLVPLQAVSPEDDEYIWPEAYMGDVDALIGILRQCPSYQIDKNHTHCGLRSKILPCLDYVKSCVDSGLGVRLVPLRNGEGCSFDSWGASEDVDSYSTSDPHLKSAPAKDDKRSFWVGNEDVANDRGGNNRTFVFSKARSAGHGTGGDGRGIRGGMDIGNMRQQQQSSEQGKARALFIAKKWDWVLEANGDVIGWSRPSYGMGGGS